MLLVLLSAGMGCAATPAPGDRALPQARPADFSLGVTVLGPQRGIERSGQRPARYLLGTDGWLRVAIGPGAKESVHPTLTRRLDPGQRDLLWALTRSAGVETVGPPLRIQSPESFDAPAGRRVYLVQFRGDGRRIGLAMPEGEPGTAPFAALADRLAHLSWVQPPRPRSGRP